MVDFLLNLCDMDHVDLGCKDINSKLLGEVAYRSKKHRDWLLDMSLELVTEVKFRLTKKRY